MTDRADRPGFTGGFEFARRLADREFRDFLRSRGYRPGQAVVIAVEEESIRNVVLRIMENGNASPCLIAIPCASERFGFRLLFAQVGPARRRWHPSRRVPTIAITPEASIGMLYAALQPCGEFVPLEWARPVVFQKVLASV